MKEKRKKYFCLVCNLPRKTTREAGCQKCGSHYLLLEEAMEASLRRQGDGVLWSWDFIEKCRNNKELQEQCSAETAKARYAKWLKPCPKCNTQPNDLTWVFWSTSPWTWQKLMGRAGWVVVCDRCKHQVYSFLEAMN